MGQGRPGRSARVMGAAGAVVMVLLSCQSEFESQTDSRGVARVLLPTPRERPIALVALGTALVLVTYVTPMASVPQTVVDLGSGSGARAWILSSMSVGLAAGLLASGALGDAFGRRRVYVAGLALLAAGSLGSAVAPSSAVFVGSRVLEGLGGAAVLACGLAILAHAFTDPAARAHATGIWGASVGLGITVGALLAAVLDFGTGWRETYAVVGAVALGLLWPSVRWLPDSKAAQPRRLDLLGVLTLAAALTLVVSGLTQARSGISTGTGVLLGLSALLLVGVRARREAHRRAHARPGPAALTWVPGGHRRRPRSRHRHHRDDVQRPVPRPGRAG